MTGPGTLPPTSAVPAADRRAPDRIGTLTRLLSAAERNRIRYCAWKSNAHLDAALAGATDLDLLVDPADADRFRGLVAAHDVKPLAPAPGGAHPGIEHRLGLDRATGRLYHLHVHHRLVLGQRYVKNHLLPMEELFLDRTRHLHGVPVPSPEVELAVLAMRTLLKYRLRDGVKDVLKVRSPGIQDAMLEEIDWLLNQTGAEQVDEVVRRSGLSLPPGTLPRFLRLAADRQRDGLQLLWLRAQVRSGLRSCRRRSTVGVLIESARVAWIRRERFRAGPPRRRMTLAGGGRTVALVGADGAGKSTIAAELARWLGWKLDVRIVYLGSNRPAPVTDRLYLAFRACRRLHRWLEARLGVEHPATRVGARARDIALGVHSLYVARGRVRRYREGLAAAARGSVVLFDRFPLEPITGTAEHRLLDGPRIPALTTAGGRLLSALARVERRLYDRFAPPDLIVALQVSPEVAVARKPDHHELTVARKGQATAALTTTRSAAASPRVAAVDADLPLDAVLLAVKGGVWDAL